MKIEKHTFIFLFVVAVGYFLNGCAPQQRVIPSKHTVPPKKAPELGARPAPKTAPDFSRGVVMDLKNRAKKQMAAGDMDQAFSTLEEAIRINPNDPAVWHLMAQIQLKKGKLDQAEALARKSNLLSGNNKALRRQNWLIIAGALEQKGLTKEASAARRQAERR